MSELPILNDTGEHEPLPPPDPVVILRESRAEIHAINILIDDLVDQIDEKYQKRQYVEGEKLEREIEVLKGKIEEIKEEAKKRIVNNKVL